MVLVLIICMAVSFGIQSWIEGGVIAGVIGINVCVPVLDDTFRSGPSPSPAIGDGRSASAGVAKVERN